MAASNTFVVNNSEFAENIEKLFNEYVALFVKLHYPDSDHAVSDEERRELTLKLRESVNQITMLAMKRKHVKVDTEIVNSPIYSTASETERTQRPAYS
jgi:hypothetical protein